MSSLLYSAISQKIAKLQKKIFLSRKVLFLPYKIHCIIVRWDTLFTINQINKNHIRLYNIEKAITITTIYQICTET